ncbi:NAD(P)/FAD-dependent oxidoreductase [Salegentibacter sp. F14]
MEHPEVIVIGGGIAGLTLATHLSQKGVPVLLFEKEVYPKHKVCGEYISREILPYLKSLGIDLLELNPPHINELYYSTGRGNSLKTTLPMGGLGISRYKLDNFLWVKAKESGAELSIAEVVEVNFGSDQKFEIITSSGEKYKAPIVLGAFGKRSNIDKKLERNFIKKKSPWLAVKSHYSHPSFPENQVALHNFKGGYCGLSKTESGAVNVCYLVSFSSFKKFKDPTLFKEKILMQNRNLHRFFDKAEGLFEKELSIAQVSFSKKKAVQGHVLMIGDAAGLIHPLCGNGMAMAIHSAKIAAEVILAQKKERFRRENMEEEYVKRWNSCFRKRLQAGRMLQNILLNPSLAEVSHRLVKNIPSLLPTIISQTHGRAVL